MMGSFIKPTHRVGVIAHLACCRVVFSGLRLNPQDDSIPKRLHEKTSRNSNVVLQTQQIDLEDRNEIPTLARPELQRNSTTKERSKTLVSFAIQLRMLLIADVVVVVVTDKHFCVTMKRQHLAMLNLCVITWCYASQGSFSGNYLHLKTQIHLLIRFVQAKFWNQTLVTHRCMNHTFTVVWGPGCQTAVCIRFVNNFSSARTFKLRAGILFHCLETIAQLPKLLCKWCRKVNQRTEDSPLRHNCIFRHPTPGFDYRKWKLEFDFPVWALVKDNRSSRKVSITLTNAR